MRLLKVVGIMHAKETLTQAFVAPLSPLLERWKRTRRFHDVGERLRNLIRVDTQNSVEEKLRGTSFIPLGVERLAETKENKAGPPGEEEWTLKQDDDHRAWEPIQVEAAALLGLDSRYILMGSVGTGKTSFLYWLALKVVEATDRIPYPIRLRDRRNSRIRSWLNLVDLITERYGNRLPRLKIPVLSSFSISGATRSSFSFLMHWIRLRVLIFWDLPG